MRIRTVKPEFWQSERIGCLPIHARLLFIGLWGLADDHGRFRANPALIAGQLFPYDRDADVAAWLDALVAARLVQVYTAVGSRYGHVIGFEEHQKIDKRWPSKLPPPPERGDIGVAPERTSNGPGKRTESHQGNAEAREAPARDSAGLPNRSAGLPNESESRASAAVTSNPDACSEDIAQQSGSLPDQSGGLPDSPPLDQGLDQGVRMDGWMDGGSPSLSQKGRTSGPGTGSSDPPAPPPEDPDRAAGALAAVSRLASAKGVRRHG